MLKGSCHCGNLSWRLVGEPSSVTACNCTVCRRYGTLWAYGHEGEDVQASGATQAYAWGDQSLGFHFCPRCGCVAFWRATSAAADGRRRMAVNLRLAEPDDVAHIPVNRFDGLDSFTSGGQDGRCVSDLLF